MKRGSICIGALGVLVLAVSADTARASWHLWDIVEVYSSPDGSVQFVEFFTDQHGENAGNILNRRLESDDNVLVFAATLPVLTANQSLLIGTTSYAALPGVPAPDFTVADNFFDVTGDMLEILESAASVIDSLTFTALDLPLDGTLSLNRPFNGGAFSTAVNSPKNFSGATGTVVLPGVPGDADGDGDVDLDDYNIMSGNMYTNVAGGADDGDFDDDGDVDFEDFVIQALNFGDFPAAEESISALPEPATAALLTGAALVFIRLPRRIC